VWRTRSNEIAQTFTELLYPSVLIEQEIVDRTDRYLAEENPQPALRRALVENRDTVARALRARARDSSGASGS
jgi:aminopeptidase N